MIVVGIDPSSHKLAAVVTDGDKIIDTLTIKLRDDKQIACGQAFRWIQECIIDPHNMMMEGHIYMEAPIMGVGGPGSTIPQAQIGGAVMAGAAVLQVSLTLANNQAWKRQVCGKGNIRKDQVAGAMLTVWPELVHRVGADQDLIDAGAINMYGRRAVRLRAKVVRHRAKGMQS